MVGLLYGSKWFAWRFQEIFPRSTLSRSFPLSRHLTYHHHHRRRRHPHHHPYCQHHQYHHCIMALVVECPTDQKLCWYVKNVENRTQHNSGQEFLSPKTKYFAQDCLNAEFHTFVQKCGYNTSFTVFLKRRDGQIASNQYFIRFMAIQKYQEISYDVGPE